MSENVESGETESEEEPSVAAPVPDKKPKSEGTEDKVFNIRLRSNLLNNQKKYFHINITCKTYLRRLQKKLDGQVSKRAFVNPKSLSMSCLM